MADVVMDWHWRDSMRPARFFMFDARSGLLVAMLLAHPRSYTFLFFILVMIFFYVLERVGLTFEAALRRIRSWLAGTSRPAIIWTARIRMIDYGATGT